MATYDFGYFNASKYYPIKLIQVEKDNSEFIQIQYRATGDSYSSNWLGLLRNLIDGTYIRPFFSIQTTGEISPAGPIPCPLVTGKIRKIPLLFGPTG